MLRSPQPSKRWLRMSNALMKLGLLLIVLSAILGGCATRTPMSVPDSFCQIDHPVTWSKADTDQTIREIKIHNARYRAVCENQ
jgi:type IV pilus biogenesis protein CpaD/CtpE